VLVGGGIPEFHDLAVAQMEDVRFLDLDAPAAPAGREEHQRDAVLFVGEECMKVSAEGSLRDLHDLAKEPEDRLPPAVLTRQLIPPAVVPQQVLGKQIVENSEIALGEGGSSVPDTSDVRMLGHDLPLPVADGRKQIPTSGIPAGDGTSQFSARPERASRWADARSSHSPHQGWRPG